MPLGLCIRYNLHSVGFGIAYPWAKAMREPVSGMSNETRIPALFLCVFSVITSFRPVWDRWSFHLMKKAIMHNYNPI